MQLAAFSRGIGVGILKCHLFYPQHEDMGFMTKKCQEMK